MHTVFEIKYAKCLAGTIVDLYITDMPIAERVTEMAFESIVEGR